MSAGPELALAAATAASAVISGIATALRPPARVCGVLLVLAGVTCLAAGVARSAGASSLSTAGFTMVAALWMPLALTACPGPAWRHPVDVGTVLLIAGAGGWAVLHSGDGDLVAAATTVVVLAVATHGWWALERADAVTRRALLWPAVTVVLIGLVLGLATFATPTAHHPAVALALSALLGPAMYLAVARPDVLDVRGLVVQAAVFTMAFFGYVALFTGAAAVHGLLGGQAPSVGFLAVTGALAAGLFSPARGMLRSVMDELLFGGRPDPLGAASRIAGRIGDDPAQALDVVRDALVLPYLALRLDGATVATTGAPVAHVRKLPLALDGQAGELVVGLRAGDLRLPAADDHVLRVVAPLLAQTVRSQRLAADLQASRELTVTALEEERRRLRRDLHDGLGPTLSGIAFTSDAARNTLRTDPGAAEALLDELRRAAAAAVGDIRRLAYAMRPPALDELGLVPALEQFGTGLRTPAGAGLELSVDTPSPLPALPAAVEVAAYRIAAEALLNCARHSGTAQAYVRLEAPDGVLTVEVRDGGTRNARWVPGVGVAAMRERAEEIGGTLTATPTSTGGRVTAVLPLKGRAGDPLSTAEPTPT